MIRYKEDLFLNLPDLLMTVHGQNQNRSQAKINPDRQEEKKKNIIASAEKPSLSHSSNSCVFRNYLSLSVSKYEIRLTDHLLFSSLLANSVLKKIKYSKKDNFT